MNVKLKVGYKWKSFYGPCKGEWFVITNIDNKKVSYKKLKDGEYTYTLDRNLFQKYLDQANKYWRDKKKQFKTNKQKLKVKDEY